jgi:hypothetical protein
VFNISIRDLTWRQELAGQPIAIFAAFMTTIVVAFMHIGYKKKRREPSCAGATNVEFVRGGLQGEQFRM